jgi:hypothetical protein
MEQKVVHRLDILGKQSHGALLIGV